MSSQGNHLRYAAFAASIACYGTALCLPALRTLDLNEEVSTTHSGWLSGIESLLIGWTALHPAWLANIAWAASLAFLALRRDATSAIAGLIGAALALTTFVSLPLGPYRFALVSTTITGPGPGFYAWSAAMWIPSAAAMYLWRDRKRRDAADAQPLRF